MVGGTEILVIGIVILVLFGASAVPRFARSLGLAKREFEKGLKEGATDKPDEGTSAPASVAPASEPRVVTPPEPASPVGGSRPATRRKQQRRA